MSPSADPRELFQRFEGNPILRPHDFPKLVNAVFNPGATVVDGRTLLLLRVEYRTGLSALVAATSEDGLTGWEIDPVRGLQPESDRFEEHWGIEDPRITRVGDEYFVVYVGYSTAGPLVCLAKTRDFVQWERSGVLQPPEDKDAALFPTRFAGRWALIHRPAPEMSGLGAHIWLSFSPDLRHWGDARVLPRHGAVVGGTPTRWGSGLLRSSPRMVGFSASTEYGSLHPGRSTGSGWPCWTRTTRPRFWRAETSGCSARTKATNDQATCPTLCSRAVGSCATTATPCTSTTAPRTAWSVWRRRVWKSC